MFHNLTKSRHMLVTWLLMKICLKYPHLLPLNSIKDMTSFSTWKYFNTLASSFFFDWTWTHLVGTHVLTPFLLLLLILFFSSIFLVHVGSFGCCVFVRRVPNNVYWLNMVFCFNFKYFAPGFVFLTPFFEIFIFDG